MSLTNRSEVATFFRSWVQGPLKVGCMFPSSRAMGRAFAKMVDRDRAGDILELGSGTGAITQGLVEGGVPPERLVLVECDPNLVVHLARRFSGARIIEGDAVEVCRDLKRKTGSRIATVVSTLPIVWFPLEQQRTIVDACLAAMGDGGRFLQMTNIPRSPLPRKPLGLKGTCHGPVWLNFPPSFIWRYWR